LEAIDVISRRGVGLVLAVFAALGLVATIAHTHSVDVGDSAETEVTGAVGP
jgi:hypothetical protein